MVALFSGVRHGERALPLPAGRDADLKRIDAEMAGLERQLARFKEGANQTNGISGSAANVFGLAGANSVVTNFNGMGQPFSSSLTPNSSANGFYQIVGRDFQATLKAIAAAGKAQVLSRPSVLARDGQLAKIVIGQQVYLPSGVSFTTNYRNLTERTCGPSGNYNGDDAPPVTADTSATLGTGPSPRDRSLSM
jgi:hypothetical protein